MSIFAVPVLNLLRKSPPSTPAVREEERERVTGVGKGEGDGDGGEGRGRW